MIGEEFDTWDKFPMADPIDALASQPVNTQEFWRDTFLNQPLDANSPTSEAQEIRGTISPWLDKMPRGPGKMMAPETNDIPPQKFGPQLPQPIGLDYTWENFPEVDMSTIRQS